MKVHDINKYFPNQELRDAITAKETGEVEEGMFAQHLFKADNINVVLPQYIDAVNALEKRDQDLMIRLVDKCQKVYEDKDTDLRRISEEVHKKCHKLFEIHKASVTERRVRKEGATLVAKELFGSDPELLDIFLNGKRAKKGYATWKDFAKNLFRAMDKQDKKGRIRAGQTLAKMNLQGNNQLLRRYLKLLKSAKTAGKHEEIIDKLIKKFGKEFSERLDNARGIAKILLLSIMLDKEFKGIINSNS